MLAFDEVHVNQNMSSQLNYNSIEKPSDFTFCDIPKRKYHRNHDENEDPSEFSPPLWSKNIHSNATSSPSSPNKTMVEARKELMEMMNDLPESCFELSLKDIVAKEPDDHSGLVMEHMVDMKPELKGKKKSPKAGPISRSVSLDTGVFLLKMFVPSSFGSKKHPVTRSSSIDGLKRCHVDVKQRKNRYFVEDRSSISSRSYNDSRRCTIADKNRFHFITTRKLTSIDCSSIYGISETDSRKSKKKVCRSDFEDGMLVQIIKPKMVHFLIEKG